MPLSPADQLDVARLPGTGGAYFIGPFMPRVTFYSQQVRALELAHAMHSLDVIDPDDLVAVVGAGAAGTTTALALALLGKQVTLYDPATEILSLQSASARLLHPHIYEWPRLGSLDDRAGLPIMDWSAASGGTVTTGLRTEFALARPPLANLAFVPSHMMEEIVPEGTGWRLRFRRPGAADEVRVVQHAVLAMGFGDERPAGTISPPDYWRPAAIGTAASEPVAGAAYVISGNGDGALTETLGLLVSGFEHVAFTRSFLGFFRDDALRIATHTAFDGAAPLSDVESALRAHVLPLLQTHSVLDRLRPMLRKDRDVTINSDGPLFSAGKASQLNQLMVLAVLEAAALEGITIRRSTGFVTNGSESPAGVQIAGTLLDGHADDSLYKHAILRHGPDTGARYAPAGALIGQYRTHVENLLVSTPALAAPPQLSAATFALFESLRIDKIADHASRLMQRELAATRKRQIEISVDPAAHVVVERGNLRLADVAVECERLTDRVTIDLHVSPKNFAEAACLVRLARCSDGKIGLRVGAAFSAAWKELDPGIPIAPASATAAAVNQYLPGEISPAVDASLVRALDTAIQQAVVTGNAPPIGPVAPCVLAVVQATWATWQTALAADAGLRFDFLRWLANVDQRVSSPWDGDRSMGVIQRMANALIMVAATHAEEAMVPSSAEFGNLSFATDAVALGTGCEAVGGAHLSVRRQPDDWGVDALILSAANEVVVQDSPGRVLDGGMRTTMMTAARRVRPAIIQNDGAWRGRLQEGLDPWKAAVAEEFAALRARQDAEVTGVTA